MRRTIAWAAAMALCAGLLAGCQSPQSYQFPSETSGQRSGQTSAGTSPNDGLEAERKAAGIADCPAGQADASPVEGGLPAVVLPCLGGGSTVNLAALRGRPMVINFWAQWCGPCRDEAPYLAASSKAWGDRVMFLGIDTQDPKPAMAIAFAKEAGWSYPQLFDQDAALRQPPLQISALPQTILVSAEGKIVWRERGVISSQAQLDQLIATHLGVS